MAKGKTRRKGSVAQRPKSEKPRDANGAREPSSNGTPGQSPTNGLNHALEHATRVLGGALGGGYTGARAAAGMLEPDAMAAALMVCMPDEWTEDDEAQGLVHRLSNDEASIVLAWLAAQWRDGYSAAVVDLREGRRPLTELGP
jgi:hypothetical protein